MQRQNYDSGLFSVQLVSDDAGLSSESAEGDEAAVALSVAQEGAGDQAAFTEREGQCLAKQGEL